MSHAMHTCPLCGGFGQIAAHIAYTNKPHYMGPARCDKCKGTGKITEEAMDRYNRGRAMRDNRIARGVSLRNEAAKLGLTVLELSRLERGEVIAAPETMEDESHRTS